MSNLLIALVGIVVIDAAIGTWALLARRHHALVLGRARDGTVTAPTRRHASATSTESSRGERWRETVEGVLPDGLLAESNANRLVRAGFDSLLAPSVYALLRLINAIMFPAIALLLVPRDTPEVFITAMALSVFFGIGLPPVILLRVERARQDRIRHAVPDTLDLLLVCVEAGVSLDAAVLRVGREMLLVHPELAEEFLIVNRKTNAGMRREEALHGLYERTGVDELRALVSSMIQCERWGSSIGRVLRVFSESLRRRRRQVAEKKAAVAGPKMVVPMVLFILPALMAVVGGPLMLGILPVLDALGK